jgi:hypothetical protein
MKIHRLALGTALAVATLTVAIVSHSAHAQDAGEFSLQVTPSPLVTTLKPGQSTTVEVKIRNQSTNTEHLKIQPRSFTFDSKTQDIKFEDTAPPVAQWLKFSAPTFSIAGGQTVTEQVSIALPKEAGFSYSFALVISRSSEPNNVTDSGRQLKGSLALFTLINVDRPGATRKLELGSITTSKNVYEYLPAEVDIELKNTGNSIFQPLGNVFIQRGKDDKTPISTLPLNQNNAYILPGTTRIVKAQWTDGFQVEKTTTATDGTTKKQVEWDWSNLSHLRIGRYTAKVVAIYNDGQRDIPLEGTVSFWVIPWKALLVALTVLLLVGAGVWSIVSKFVRLSKRAKRRR